MVRERGAVRWRGGGAGLVGVRVRGGRALEAYWREESGEDWSVLGRRDGLVGCGVQCRREKTKRGCGRKPRMVELHLEPIVLAMAEEPSTSCVGAIGDGVGVGVCCRQLQSSLWTFRNQHESGLAEP